MSLDYPININPHLFDTFFSEIIMIDYLFQVIVMNRGKLCQHKSSSSKPSMH